LNKNTKNIYILNEPKREFYEETTFDYFSLKRTITRFIRLPIKFIDQNNCKHAKLIISNSNYTFNQILKIYNKKSFVVYPGLEFVKPEIISIKNNKKFVSIGPFLKIKGHAFSLNQLNNYVHNLTIIGQKIDEYPNIKALSIKNNISINEIATENDQIKILELKKHTFYLANNEKEPFGLTTLEAASNDLFVLGKNQGGTNEIIQNGLNGILYPDNLDYAHIEIKRLLTLKYIELYKTTKSDWKSYTNKIMKIYNHYYA
jgi:glycosyltransferase involved in cell wall biosynthesis